MASRSGIGYDVHRLIEGRPLILGGVDIPSEKGLDGHSDADVLCHAIADALLGAVGLPDIGYYFPPTDESIKGICSLDILKNSFVYHKANRLSRRNMKLKMIHIRNIFIVIFRKIIRLY